MMDYSQIVAEGSAQAVQEMGEFVGARLEVIVLRAPKPAMVMVRHVDPLQRAPFYLGEAYVTECEVEVDGRHGYGCCLGRSEERALCAAIVDAVVGTGHPVAAELAPLLEAEKARIRERRRQDGKAPATTTVDFEVQ
jgi:alpha-D-ribose 1-methylphosphonate 5-triphosphate synthase subunit PhnG